MTSPSSYAKNPLTSWVAGSAEKNMSVAEQEEEDVTASEENSKLEVRLRKEGWYLGEMSVATAAAVLTASKTLNSFIVYRCSEAGHQFVLSARFHIDDMDEDVFEDILIEKTEKGKYCLTGQSEVFDDLIEVVSNFVQNTNPPLKPALRGRSFEKQLSFTSAPPDYDKVNRVLKPEIAKLPDISTVKVEDPQEAKVGTISPVSSRRVRSNTITDNSSEPPPEPPSYLSRSIWLRYEEYHRCHPKNVCHGCCHRPEEWTGHRVYHIHKWYDCRKSGPLRVLGLIMFWLLCGVCFGCYKLCFLIGYLFFYLIVICCYICC